MSENNGWREVCEEIYDGRWVIVSGIELFGDKRLEPAICRWDERSTCWRSSFDIPHTYFHVTHWMPRPDFPDIPPPPETHTEA